MIALERVQHHLVFPEVVEGLPEVTYQVGTFPGHDSDVVDVGVNIPTDLLLQASLHYTLVSRTCIFQTKRHSNIAISTKRRNKGCRFLIRLLHPNLMITEICIKKTQKFRPRRRVNDLVNARQGVRGRGNGSFGQCLFKPE